MSRRDHQPTSSGAHALPKRARKRAGRRSWGQRLVLLFNVIAIAASLMVAAGLGYANERASAVNRVALDRSLTDVEVTASGARVINILLVGSDSSADLDPDDPIQIGRQGERLGDVIIIAHIDERTGEVALLSLPRDLWVPIAGTERENRINRAFLVGGPAMLIDTIEENFDIPIHHYVNVDFAGFQGLVEAVGSVDVYFDAPARDWNVNARPEPRSQTGFLIEEPGCYALDPEQALAYVRSRYYQTQDDTGRWITDPTSDLGRIARQQEFLQLLLQEAIDQGARNPLVLASLIDTGIENVAIDQELTPSLLVSLSETYRSFEPGDLQTYTFPVVDRTVGVNRVLVPRTTSAEPLLALFGGEPFDSPTSIGLSLVYAEPSGTTNATAEGSSTTSRTVVPNGVEAIVDELVDRDFDVESEPGRAIDDGLWVRHGPEGASAAAVVVAALADAGLAATTVEVDHLTGRNVVVVLGADVAESATDALLTQEEGATDAVASGETVDSALGDAAGGSSEPTYRQGVLSATPSDGEGAAVVGPEAAMVDSTISPDSADSTTALFSPEDPSAASIALGPHTALTREACQ